MRKRSMPSTHDLEYRPFLMRSRDDMHTESSAIEVCKSEWHTRDGVARSCGQRHQQGVGRTYDDVGSCLRQASVDVLFCA